MPWTLALDLLTMVLLVATIVATVVLNRRLTCLRDARSELEALADQFRASTSRADEGVAGLKVKAQSLQEQLDAARGLAADLEFLIERGGDIADRLEADVRAARRSDGKPTVTAGVTAAAGVASGSGAAAAAGKARPREAAEPRSAAERHLMAALRTRA